MDLEAAKEKKILEIVEAEQQCQCAQTAINKVDAIEKDLDYEEWNFSYNFDHFLHQKTLFLDIMAKINKRMEGQTIVFVPVHQADILQYNLKFFKLEYNKNESFVEKEQVKISKFKENILELRDRVNSCKNIADLEQIKVPKIDSLEYYSNILERAHTAQKEWQREDFLKKLQNITNSFKLLAINNLPETKDMIMRQC